jgi:transposase
MAATAGGLHREARRSARIERQAEEILALVRATPDFTLAEIADHLFKAHGDRFVPSVIWRFFDRRNVTFKKTSHASKDGCTINRGLGRRYRRRPCCLH